MITLTNRDTCRYCHVPEEYISGMEELQDEDSKRVYPYTRLHIVDSKQKHDYYIDVVESTKRINLLIEQCKLKPKETSSST